MGWIAERRIVVWLNTTRADLFSFFQPLETLWDAVMAVLRTAFGGATIPLLWLAVAGIIYGVSMPDWRGAARRVVGDRADRVFDRAAAGRKRFSGARLADPTDSRREGKRMGKGKVGDYSPIVDSARLILHGGVLGLTLYILGYLGLAWLDMAGAFYHPEVGIGYLFRFTAWLFGPHPLSFWNGFSDIHRSDLARDRRTAPGVLDRVDRRLLSRTGANGDRLQQQAHRDGAVEAGDVHRGRNHILGQQERVLK